MDADGEKKEAEYEDMMVENEDAAAKETVEAETPATPSKRVAIDAPSTLLTARPPDPPTLQDIQRDFETTARRGQRTLHWGLFCCGITVLTAWGVMYELLLGGWRS